MTEFHKTQAQLQAEAGRRRGARERWRWSARGAYPRDNIARFMAVKDVVRGILERTPMSKSIACLILIVVAVGTAHSQELECNPSAGKSSYGDDYEVWKCKITPTKTGTTLELRITVPNSTHIEGISGPSSAWSHERITGNLREITFTTSTTCDQLKLFARKSVTTVGYIRWTIKETIKTASGIETFRNNGTTIGPVAMYDPSIIRPVIAIGASQRLDDPVDYTEENQVLLVENNSTLRPSVFAGALVNLFEFQSFFGKHFSEKKTFDLLLSLEFASATPEAIDGFAFGLGVGVNRYVELFGGVSIRVGKELSPGFLRAASQLLDDINGLPTESMNPGDAQTNEKNRSIQAKYSRFSNTEGIKARDLDGFALNSPITNQSIFPGSPIIESTNTALIIGVALPVDIVSLIRGR